MNDKSESNAWLMLNHYVESVTANLGDYIQAILLTGSLVTHSYIPGPGDIDQITILDNSAPHGTEKLVVKYIEDTKCNFNKIINIAGTVYQRHNLERPWKTDWDLRPETKHLVTVPEELLRIHDHGQVIWNRSFDLCDLPVPTMQEMIDYTERWHIWNSEFRDRYLELKPPDPMPVRLSVQSLLSSATIHYYFATGHTCFNKHKIAEKLLTEVPEYLFHEALRLATQVRTSGFTNVSDEIEAVLNQYYQELAEWKKTHPGGSVPIS